MTWYFQKLPRHPVSTEKVETRRRNNIIFNYHYRVVLELGKGVCVISEITCECPDCVLELDKYWLPTITPSSQPGYAHAENCYHNQIIEHYNDWIIMKFLDNTTS